jgi:hypothetical protein
MICYLKHYYYVLFKWLLVFCSARGLNIVSFQDYLAVKRNDGLWVSPT